MMQRTRAVLEKLQLLAERRPDRTVIDIDLMLDYTRVLYADLLEIRNGMAARSTTLSIDEPTLDELTAALAVQEDEPLPHEAPQLIPAVKQPLPHVPAAAVHPAPPAADSRDIRRLIDLNDKYLFLSELFRNDLSAYERGMQQLSGHGSEEEALGWIAQQHWPEHGEAVETLRGTVKRLYAA